MNGLYGMDNSIIISAVITAGATIANAILIGIFGRPKQKEKGQDDATNRRDSYVSIFRVITVGVTAGLISVLLFQQIDELSNTQRRSNSTLLSSFAETPSDIDVPIRVANEAAKAILDDGAGPKVYDDLERTWKVGDVVYANRTEVITQLNVMNPSDAEEKQCLIELEGKLTILGFSKERKSALIEYTAPGEESEGCASSVYFFYPIE